MGGLHRLEDLDQLQARLIVARWCRPPAAPPGAGRAGTRCSGWPRRRCRRRGAHPRCRLIRSRRPNPSRLNRPSRRAARHRRWPSRPRHPNRHRRIRRNHPSRRNPSRPNRRWPSRPIRRNWWSRRCRRCHCPAAPRPPALPPLPLPPLPPVPGVVLSLAGTQASAPENRPISSRAPWVEKRWADIDTESGLGPPRPSIKYAASTRRGILPSRRERFHAAAPSRSRALARRSRTCGTARGRRACPATSASPTATPAGW